MSTDYEAMACIIRHYGRRGAGHTYDSRSLAAHAGVSVERVREVVPEMMKRGYLSASGNETAMPESARHLAGKNAPQFLALDVIAWIKGNRTKEFTAAQLPAELQEDGDLLVIALEELRDARAIGPRTGGSLLDVEFVVQPHARVYEFGRVSPLTSLEVHQHVGDVNVNTGPGAIVTGGHNVVTINADAAERFRSLVECLRAQGEIAVSALDALHRAARPDASNDEAAGAAMRAVAEDRRVIDNLKAWALSVPSHLAKAAIVETIKLVLKANGVLPG